MLIVSANKCARGGTQVQWCRDCWKVAHDYGFVHRHDDVVICVLLVMRVNVVIQEHGLAKERHHPLRWKHFGGSVALVDHRGWVVAIPLTFIHICGRVGRFEM